jgi:NADH-quinone oxidoreductase subunit J
MIYGFYVAAVIALLSTVMVVTRRHPVHALLYLVVSLLAVAVIFYILGAPFTAALEVIIYAGAIMVLFVFVIMLLNLGGDAVEREGEWLKPRVWVGPSLLAAILAAILVQLVIREPVATAPMRVVAPKEVGVALFGPYLIGVEVAAFLLLAGLVGAFHLGRRMVGRQGRT